MKIPKSVKIGAYTYKVKTVKVLTHNGNDLTGLCDNDKCVISILDGMTKVDEKIVLIHECLHAIENAYGIQIGEKRVGKLDHALTALLTDNDLEFYD